ncbi:hypothetical protein K493DRAFT_294999 [Basidiobolus meristosporus CBS 931.73]|uniref:Uncharacterized protein n=1 Tax=Basidiobolus meristosporus CBS 931.73 TaxID=1314790 RepID=A0A1Y1WYP2_9FUNG|nr:hypothetical protein K493DRAFT_391527 [Basidiobolus meristosporus CBS 931.73]ORY08405.1 hypothetical protein K493DRAFT_294999 [Basidiobolus meristosporus CBS 931.73]|eukprot:ORX78697.1 hypothetical protein K493DRAFT_391527 [Basidiobolus meristosporus CBS 931.73]
MAQLTISVFLILAILEHVLCARPYPRYMNPYYGPWRRYSYGEYWRPPRMYRNAAKRRSGGANTLSQVNARLAGLLQEGDNIMYIPQMPSQNYRKSPANVMVTRGRYFQEF